MSDETQLIKFIPSEALAKEFPEFNKLDIYGTTENPLIATQQFQDLLGLDRLRLDKGEYDYGEDYIQMKCKGKDGKFREQNMLTEKGLYTVLARSHTELGKKFMRFVLVVMRELRTKGQVELEDALKKLVTYDHQLTEEHHLMQKY
jgi:prophage antirepressor-like protein